MAQIINLLVVLLSLGGILFILGRKIPLLRELPSERELRVRDVVSQRVAMASKNLDKTLSKARTLASKTETRTAEWFERLHKKSEEHKEEFSESYREQLSKKPEE